MTARPGHVEFGEYRLIKGSAENMARDLLHHFREMMACKLEGLVVKAAAGPYVLGGHAWLKIKAGYLEKGGMSPADVAGPASPPPAAGVCLYYFRSLIPLPPPRVCGQPDGQRPGGNPILA